METKTSLKETWLNDWNRDDADLSNYKLSEVYKGKDKRTRIWTLYSNQYFRLTVLKSLSMYTWITHIST